MDHFLNQVEHSRRIAEKKITPELNPILLPITIKKQ